CRYGRCSATSAKKGNLRRHIRQVHKTVRPVDADLYIEEDQQILQAEDKIYATQFCTRKRWNALSGGGSLSNAVELLQFFGSAGDSSTALSDFDSSDFDSSDVLSTELNITNTPFPNTNASSSSSSAATSTSSPKTDSGAISIPPAAISNQFSTIFRTTSGHYL